MRVVRWQDSARRQFNDLLDYIDDQNPEAAERLRANFEERIDKLGEWPGIGRPGRVNGTREFVLQPNYVAVYRVAGDDVIIVRILHARQQYP